MTRTETTTVKLSGPGDFSITWSRGRAVAVLWIGNHPYDLDVEEARFLIDGLTKFFEETHQQPGELRGR